MADKENWLNDLLPIAENFSNVTQRIAENSKISRMTVWRSMKHEKFEPQ